MKRILAGGLSVTLGLAAASSRADDVIWRAVGSKAPAAQTQAAAEAPVQPVVPAGGVGVFRLQSRPGGPLAATATVDPAGWVRVRAQNGGEEPASEPPPAPIVTS